MTYEYSSPEEFIATWLDSESVREVAERLGVTVQAVYGRANYFRARGIELPKFERRRVGRPRLDVDALNTLIARSTGKGR